MGHSRHLPPVVIVHHPQLVTRDRAVQTERQELLVSPDLEHLSIMSSVVGSRGFKKGWEVKHILKDLNQCEFFELFFPV